MSRFVPDSSSRPHVRLAPVLGLVSASAIVVGEVIGSGIFFKPSQVAQATGGYVGVILTLWAACGLVNLCGALTLAELAAMFPEAGGTYVFLREAYGRMWAFLWGWTEFWVIRTGATAALAVYSAAALDDVLHAAGISWMPDRPKMAEVLAASSLIAVLGAINVIGTRWGGAVQNVATLLKAGFVALLAVLPLVALRSKLIDPSPLWPPAINGSLIAGIGTALAAIMWAYDGWGNVTVMAEEIHEPQRNLPRALIAGVALLTVLYTGANLAYHLTLSSEAIAQERIPAVAVMAKLLPGWGTHIMHVMLWVSVCGALNGNILVGPRVLFALARDYRALSPFERVPAATGTPALAIVAVCGWSMLLVCLGNLSPDPEVRLFDLLTVYCIFGGSIFYFSAVLAVFVLRITQPEAPRPYRTWGYPWTPALFVVFYVFLLYRMYADRPFECLAGLTFIGIGGVVYLLVSPRGTLGEGK